MALMSVLTKCYATTVVLLLSQEKEMGEWRELHVGAERGEHMQALVTNLLQRHLQWQDIREEM